MDLKEGEEVEDAKALLEEEGEEEEGEEEEVLSLFNFSTSLLNPSVSLLFSSTTLLSPAISLSSLFSLSAASSPSLLTSLSQAEWELWDWERAREAAESSAVRARRREER